MASLGYHEALVRRGNALHIARVPTEPPRAGGLVIALSFVGVCGTDLQILNGTRPDTAEILGHEGLGTVVNTAGKGPLMEGAQVVFNPAAQLARGRILGHNTPGLFQRYITVDSEALEEGLVMPANHCNPPECGALIEPLATIVYAHELISNAVPDIRTAVVFGAGPVGLLATIYLGTLGTRVLLVHRTQKRIDTVARLEIPSRVTTLVASDDVVERIAAHNGGRAVDAALICTTRTGAPSALRQAVQVVRDGGCIDLVTNYPENAPAPHDIDASALRAVRSANICGLPKEGSYRFWNIPGRRIAFSSHRGTSHAHLRKAMQALSSEAASYIGLITHVLPLREAAGAIECLAQSTSHVIQSTDCIKLVINMTSA
jgi:2-epi-valiolone-7-phosphate 1-reductase